MSAAMPGNDEATQAGWYTDPEDDRLRRYWDGAAWTTHVQWAQLPPPETDTPVAGWYPDPRSAQHERFWAGTTWTPNVRSAQGPSAPAARQTALRRRGLRTLSAWLQGALWTSGVAAVLMAGFAIAALQAFDPTTGPDLRFIGALDLLGITELLWIGVHVVAGTLWIVWLFRSHRQLERVRGSAGRRSRGWTIGGWFVPIANLWIPKQVHDDIHARTGDLPGELDQRSPLLGWWWGFWIATLVLSRVPSTMWPTTLDDSMTNWLWAELLWAVAEVVLAVLAVKVIRQLTSRLDRVAAEAGLGGD